MKKIILTLISLTVLSSTAMADKYMDEYKRKDLRRNQVYKNNTSDLRPEIADELEVNPLDDEPTNTPSATTMAPEAPQMAIPGVGGLPGGSGAMGGGDPSMVPQIPQGMGSPNMTLEQAKELGRALRDSQSTPSK